jgi:hypothetical protein
MSLIRFFFLVLGIDLRAYLPQFYT